MPALPSIFLSLVALACLATGLLAPAKALEPKESTLKIKDNVPAGFENLLQDQTLFVEVQFNDKRIGTFEVNSNSEELTFSDPSKLLDTLENIKKPPELLQALSATLPTNAHLICFARNEPVGCGQIDPAPIAAIFNESLLKLELFIAPELQLVQKKTREKYLPTAIKRSSSIIEFNALASDSIDESSVDLTTRARTSYGAGHIFAEAEYNTRTDSARVRSLQLTHLFRDQELTVGTFNHGAGSLLNNTQILGASLNSSYRTRIDLDETFSSQLIVYLPRRSLVQIVVDERVYLAQRYDAGNQTLDTGTLPGGTYELEIRINDPVTGARSEYHLFTRSTQIPPRNETSYDFTVGVPVTFSDDTFPERRGVFIGGASAARRISDQSSLRLGILSVGALSLAEAQYLRLGKNISLQLGIGGGTQNIHSGSLRLSMTHNRTLAAVNAQWFSASQSAYDDTDIERIMPRRTTQLGASVSRSFGKTSVSTRISHRTSTNISGQEDTSTLQTLSLRQGLFQKRSYRANLQANYRRSENGYQVNVSINGTLQRARVNTRLSLRTEIDENGDQSRQQDVTHRVRSEFGALTTWNAELSAGSDDVGQTVGIAANMENDILAAAITNDWTQGEDSSRQQISTARLGTRVAIDRYGIAMGGSRSASSGMILDIRGEPHDAEYEIVINGSKTGIGRVNSERFIGLAPLKQYSVQLLPTTGLTSSLVDSSFNFTIYPGAVQRIQTTAHETVLLIASVVTPDGFILNDGYIIQGDNPLRLSPEGLLQIEATPGKLLEIQRDNGLACRIEVPMATEQSDISIPSEPLICQ